jgi:hypothetical protein
MKKVRDTVTLVVMQTNESPGEVNRVRLCFYRVNSKNQQIHKKSVKRPSVATSHSETTQGLIAKFGIQFDFILRNRSKVIVLFQRTDDGVGYFQ